ncbi:hypothetical protein MN116_008154 [Schistosoma mekongi]|uniref:Regulator of telomere elongation helicase 1 homolog n=1 Tax=Schistosoma mekongi TaxID=38744 RepID=A0AAE1Z6T4_SCHME|nr:hypothetical protein MN116_008154 [Schistosoma mekongi]
MPQIVIDGVEIDFPYQPYDCQLEYMTKVLLSLNQGKNAILESPTGTGKTLCLLCASLAWLDKQIKPVELMSTIDIKHQSGLGNFLTCDDIVNHGDNKLSRQIHSTNLNKVNNACKIIFASRTHSQLAQAINALKGTVYSKSNTSVVGSRDQLCLLPEVTSLESNSAKIYACRMRIQTKTCEYFRNFDSKRDDILTNVRLEGIVDIEDLSNFGQKTRCCPYFISRELKTDSRLIFMPYNYLLDSRIRTLYNISLENTAVIFDEAHNIEQVCEDASSVTLTSALLASAIEHVRCVCEVVFNHNIESEESETGDNSHINSNNNERKPTIITNKKELFDMTQPEESAIESLSIEKMITLKGYCMLCYVNNHLHIIGQLIELERLIDELNVPSEGLTKDGSFIFDLLSRAGINHWTNNAIQTVIDEIISFTNSANNVKIRKTKGLHEVGEFLKTVFNYLPGEANVTFNFKSRFKLQHDELISCYRLHIKDELLLSSANYISSKYAKNVWDAQSATTAVGATNRTVSYWCFSPGRAIQELIRQNIRCIILTSGTLYPFEPLEAELNMKFPITLRNPHVINSDQLNLSVIPRGPDGEKLNATYSVRETPAYRNSLGLLLVQLAQVVPAGLLIFFPSYAFMSQCIEFWKDSDTYEKLSRSKQIFIEPREKSQFNKIFNEYRSIACSENSVGAILFAVMRGRVSEGLDLADNAGRGVVILGLPYAPIHDPRVLLKMAYLDEQCVKLKSNSIKDQSQKTLIDKYPTGRQWYNLQAWRAINQAVGRVIRHYKDYGAIYLCDERFASNAAQLNLASWMHKKCKVYDNVELVVKDTYEFFRAMRNKYPSTDRLIVTSSGVNSASTEKCSLQSIKPTISSFNKSNMLSNLPSAFELNIFSPKLNDSMELVTTSYHSYQLPCSSNPYEYNTECQKGSISSSSLSIFDTVYSELENVNENTYQSCSNLHFDDNLEQRLLQRKSCKRIKLSEEKSNSLKLPGNISSTTTMNFDSTLSSKYIALLKSVLKSNEMNESVYANYLSDFKQAMQDYKQAIVFNHKSIKHPSNQPVEALFAQLSRIFIPLENPGLLQDAVCFVLPAHRKRYAELCHNLTGLPIIQPNTVDSKCANTSNQVSNSFAINPSRPMMEQEKTFEISMKCCKCSANPILVPLISCCKHVACFKCWRRIIEEGDHLCPVCKKLLRRRDLSRLTQKNAE